MERSRALSLLLVAFLCLLAQPSHGADKPGKKKDDVNEIGNRRVAHRSMISQDKEIAIGRQYANEIDHSAKILTDSVINEYVNRVAQNVARNSDLAIPLTVKVIDAPEINAFTLPGGFIYLNSGTILAADEEDQIAGVLAHEIAHAAARHWASQVTKATIARYAMLPILFIPMGYGVYSGIEAAYMNGVPLAFLHFNRSAESEADYLGLQYMYKAGYDPNSYVGFFGKVLEEERHVPGSVPKLFLDHPPTADRIVKSEEEIKEILPKRSQYLVSTSEFEDVKARMEEVITHRRRGQPGPVLERRDGSDGAASTNRSKKGTAAEDDPPILKRKNQGRE
jgi:beta-barrel assembly-enhancing protease